MTSISVHISETDRYCEVYSEALQAWSRDLLDAVLFEAAKTVSDGHADGAVTASVTFRVSIDEEDGSIVIER